MCGHKAMGMMARERVWVGDVAPATSSMEIWTTLPRMAMAGYH